MSAVLGMAMGAGLFLMWWSSWSSPVPPRAAQVRSQSRLSRLLIRAGLSQVSPRGLVGTCLAVGLIVLLCGLAFSGSVPIAACFALFGGTLPLSIVRWRAKRRTASLQELWPDVVDHLRSAIRAGLSLPEALIQLGEKGPAELRAAFVAFGSDYRVGGRFDESLNSLKDRLADPVADRIVEALRLTREVGGSDLGRLLGTLSEFLRDSARTRNELEARQSWTINAARLAVAAPWFVLLLLATRPEAVRAYSTAAGAVVLLGGLAVSFLCYRVMLRVGSLPRDERVLR